MNSKTSNQLKTAAQAFLNGEAVESFVGSDDNRTAEEWLFEAWSQRTFDGAFEALLRVQELDPENDLAQRGLDWAEGLSSLATEILTLEQSSVGEESFGEAVGSENETETEEREPESIEELLEDQEDSENLEAESEEIVSDDECTTEPECSEVEFEDNADADTEDTDISKTTLFGFEIEKAFEAELEADEPQATDAVEDEPEIVASDALSSLESLFKPTLAIETENALSEADVQGETESTDEVVYWAGNSEDDSAEDAIAELDNSEAEAEAQRLADEVEEQRTAEEAEAQRLADQAEAQRLADEAEAQRLADEAEAQRLADEAEAQRLADEAEKLRLAEEAEAQRRADEAEAERLEAEAEAQRLAEEAEAQRQAEEAEAQRLADEEAEAQRLADEAEELRLAEEAEAQRLADEAEAKRQADEILALQQAEQLQRSEEQTEAAQDIPSRNIAPTIMFDPTQLTPPNEVIANRRTNEVTIETAPVAAEVVEEDIQQNIQDLSNEVSVVVADITPVASEVPESEAPASEAPESSELKSDGPLVMAVDDSPTIRKLVSMTLEREGFRVVTAADGLEALQLLSDHMPDIILSDVNMPRLDGYKLCRFVKKHERTKHIPVVMLSGKDGVFDKLRGKMFGCGDYITKPFDSADLVDKVRLHTGSYTS